MDAPGNNNLVTAVSDMHCYATQDCDTRISFEIYGNKMGSILIGPSAPAIHVDARDDNARHIKPVITIYKGVSGSNQPSTIIAVDTAFTFDLPTINYPLVIQPTTMCRQTLQVTAR
jgi:hypothetical protein